jgi:hypothetical protein
MGESKYYTPSIEEFHIGFEYEVLAEDFGINTFLWLKHTNPYRIEILENFIESKYVRVKYLDREDIESLGWQLKVSEEYDIFGLTINSKQGDVKVFNLIFKKHNGLQYRHIITFRKRTLFEGYIKNKSELKKLMQQLCITE